MTALVRSVPAKPPAMVLGSRHYSVAAAQAQLEAHPEVWNQHTWRTEHPNSPHREVDDIWVRYNDLTNFDPDPAVFNGPHDPVWYPVIHKLPAIRELAMRAMVDFGYAVLGGVLITRIPPGKQVYPHSDHGWHARRYEKLCVQIKGDQRQAFHFNDVSLSANDGDVYWFDNSFVHWVTNDSDRERISMIVCVRR